MSCFPAPGAAYTGYSTNAPQHDPRRALFKRSGRRLDTADPETGLVARTDVERGGNVPHPEPTGPGAANASVMKQVVKVVVRLNGRSALAKLDQARYVVGKMKANPHFAALATQVTDLETACDTLESTIIAARTGDHAAVGLKNLAEEVLMAQLAKLCDSINGIAAGDMAVLLTCGLPLRRENRPYGQLPPPVKLLNRLTSTTGRVQLEWNGPEGSRMYNVFMSRTAEPFNWEMIGVTGKQRFNADALTPGTFYWFAVTAIGAAGESSKSEPARAMAAA